MTKVFADGADLATMLTLADRVAGFTTNPTLMRQAGVKDYEAFARDLLGHFPRHPISFEVFADDPHEILRQARRIASWGENVYVKVPITTTRGRDLTDVAGCLSEEGIRVNVTAVFTWEQIRQAVSALRNGAPSYLSVFAGRIADAGVNPMPTIRKAVHETEGTDVRVIWASPREVLNYVQARYVNCDVITMTPDLIAKLDGLGKDLDRFSLETVQMFWRDGAGYEL